jgi:hypothetical protein
MFKVGDKVKIVKANTWPMEGLDKHIETEGSVDKVSEWRNPETDKLVSLFLFTWDDERTLWCAEEHLQLLSTSKQTQTTDYPSKCPCCGQKTYISLIGLIDCSSSSCPTQDPNHRRHYS